MKKLLFTSLLGLGLLLPVSFSASTNSTTSATELSAKKSKSKKSRKAKRNKAKSKSSRSYFQSGGCSYNGHKLYVGERGGCYYMAGSSKEYVDRSYCSSCR
ncbi:hypothetical protein ACM39_01065 [Chryseobacterium sp. FH2]|uniref:hypothetical protein n=1 Tax=Chryseobacterium sp. FH2 TaxID=1674291 RepID=UPI00065ABAE5|nr:hypothetical protein [Chryseobacterium sp. FH2]KMQ69679.1 hypothetical protein ACM39_01065 [Chryseobacterium sp. FH2]